MLHRRQSVDPVTHAFSWLLYLFRVDIDVELWSQYVTLALVGALVFSSIRGFVLVRRATRLLARSRDAAAARVENL